MTIFEKQKKLDFEVMKVKAKLFDVFCKNLDKNSLENLVKNREIFSQNECEVLNEIFALQKVVFSCTKKPKKTDEKKGENQAQKVANH